MNRIGIFLLLPCLVMTIRAAGEVKHPRILGVAHIAYYVSALSKARAYYEDFLGFKEAFSLKNPDGAEHLVFVKINDHQFVELIAEDPKNHGFLHDVGFETNDARGMRTYLASIGIKVPQPATKHPPPHLNFTVTAPSASPSPTP